MNLALFDLDHTLLPFDSGMAWTQFLVGVGALPPSAETDYLACCRQYVAGTLDIHAMHRACVAPLRSLPAPRLAQWLGEFERQLAPRVPAAMQALVQGHRDAGHLCALVTATTRFIAEPCSRLFGIVEVVATEAACDEAGMTGEIAGLPCYRENKVTRVEQWLAQRQPRLPATLQGFERSWFYSDSVADLPLLGAVSNPVAVRPDERLLAHALRAGWVVLG